MTGLSGTHIISQYTLFQHKYSGIFTLFQPNIDVKITFFQDFKNPMWGGVTR
jgi:hypothetical protein